MHVVLGASGHIGSVVVDRLLAAGAKVTAIAHDAGKAGILRDKGAAVAVVDLHEADALRDVLRRSRRAFLLNPPADPSGDTDAEELAMATAITNALARSGLEKIVVESTYGAQPGDAIGDLSVLCEFERRALASGIPAAINRGAYYFTNWDAMLTAMRDDGVLATPYPADLRIPMVSPDDLGAAAARRMLSGTDDSGVVHVEGPRSYSPSDVARIFAEALGRDVRVETIPRARWEQAFRARGFSDAAARAFARMTAVSVDGGFAKPADPERGPTTLEDHVTRLVGAR